MTPPQNMTIHVCQRAQSHQGAVETIWIEWKDISADTCASLVENVATRIAAVIKAKGGYKKY